MGYVICDELCENMQIIVNHLRFFVTKFLSVHFIRSLLGLLWDCSFRTLEGPGRQVGDLFK